MTTEHEQRRIDLAHNLYCAWKTLDAYKGDEPGRLDILHRIQRVEEQYREAGGSQGEFLDLCEQREAEERERVRLNREQAYERTGTVPHE
jgi:hypothetical protein